MFRRPARNAPESAQQLRRPDLRHVPHRIVGRHGNIMVQSCMVGRGCHGHELCHVLRDSGFDIIVVIQTEEVDVWDEVNLFLKTAREAQAPMRAERPVPPYISELLKEKAVFHVTDKIFVFVHRGKASSYSYTEWTGPAVADSRSVRFGSLHVDLYVDRQRAF